MRSDGEIEPWRLTGEARHARESEYYVLNVNGGGGGILYVNDTVRGGAYSVSYSAHLESLTKGALRVKRVATWRASVVDLVG